MASLFLSWASPFSAQKAGETLCFRWTSLCTLALWSRMLLTLPSPDNKPINVCCLRFLLSCKRECQHNCKGAVIFPLERGATVENVFAPTRQIFHYIWRIETVRVRARLSKFLRLPTSCTAAFTAKSEPRLRDPETYPPMAAGASSCNILLVFLDMPVQHISLCFGCKYHAYHPPLCLARN